MHELSICQGIIEVASAALRELAPTLPRVREVTVEVGRLTSVVPDTLRHYFDLQVPGTPLDGARLLIEEVPIRGHCAECGARFEIPTLGFTCPRCASGFVDLLSGRELRVVSLDTAEEVPCGS